MPKDWYRRMMLGMLPISFAFLIAMFFINPEALFFSDWFLNILLIPNFFASHLSASAYIGRATDACAPQPVAGVKERIGTWIGVVCGLAIGITLAVLKFIMPFTGIIGDAAAALYTLGSISALSGFTNRVGNSLDNNGRAKNEKRAISVALTLGLVAGFALFFTKSVALITIAGATTFFSGGLALPFILGGIVFAASASGTCASCADYLTKAFNYKNHLTTQDATIKKTVKERFHEYRGANWGVSTGLMVAGAIILGLAIAQPYIFAGIAAVLTIAAITVCCVSIFGGLFSRVGRLVDGYHLKKKQDAEVREALLSKNKPEPDDALGNKPDKALQFLHSRLVTVLKSPDVATSSVIPSDNKGLTSQIGMFGSASLTAKNHAVSLAAGSSNACDRSVGQRLSHRAS